MVPLKGHTDSVEELPAALAEITRRLHWAITRGGDKLRQEHRSHEHHRDGPEQGEPFKDRRGQVRTLHVLADGAELTMNDLATKLQVSPPTVTGLIRGLVEQGYVTRSNDENDWRVVRVVISEEGRKALSNHRQEVLNRVSGWLSELESEDMDLLSAAIPALRRLSKVLEGHQTVTGADRARDS